MRFVSTPSDSSDSVDPDDLRACLSGFPVAIAVRFGSAGTADEHALSDLDIGIVLDAAVDADRTGVLDRIRAALIETTGRDAIDLVDLEAAGPHLGYEALSTGELLVGDPDVATELETMYLMRKLDFDPIKVQWQNALDRRIEEGSFGRP